MNCVFPSLNFAFLWVFDKCYWFSSHVTEFHFNGIINMVLLTMLVQKGQNIKIDIFILRSISLYQDFNIFTSRFQYIYIKIRIFISRGNIFTLRFVYLYQLSYIYIKIQYIHIKIHILIIGSLNIVNLNCCRPEGGSTLFLGCLCFTRVQSTERTMYSRHESRYMKHFGCLFAIGGGGFRGDEITPGVCHTHAWW